MRRILSIVGFVASCAGPTQATPTAPSTGDEVVAETPASDAQSSASQTTAVPGSNEIARASLTPVIDEGLGRFLRLVEVAPVLERGAFVGFRIVRFRAADGRFDAVDLGPGDVVIRVNGSAIERPEQALAVFNGLRVVSELRVEYTRGGVRREIRYAIVD